MYDPSTEQQIERQLAGMQKRIDESVLRIEQTAARIDDAVAKKLAKSPRRADRIFWGIFLILLGGLWFGNSAGWYNVNVSWWPIVVIAFGTYLMVGGRG
jgi:fatty acid desaturase